jgi:hypothetical protein
MRRSAIMLTSDGDLRRAAALLAKVELVTLKVPWQLARTDQEYWLGQFNDLVVREQLPEPAGQATRDGLGKQRHSLFRK